jgi:hypothetical protein
MTAVKMNVIQPMHFLTFNILKNKTHTLKYNTFQADEITLGHILTVTNVRTYHPEDINNGERVTKRLINVWFCYYRNMGLYLITNVI